MRKEAYGMIREAETKWWSQGRAHVVARILKHFTTQDDKKEICDVGAGFGGMLSILKPYGKITAIEMDPSARAVCKERGYDHVLDVSDIAALDPAVHQFEMFALFDVVEHILDDNAFMKQIHTLLASKGSVIINVPAFQFLWGEFDEMNMHHRRYNKQQLSSLLNEAGFTIRYISYWNMLLFIPAAITRLLGKTGESTLGMPLWLDHLFLSIIKIESMLIPTFTLPFGTSIVVYAEKKKPV